MRLVFRSILNPHVNPFFTLRITVFRDKTPRFRSGILPASRRAELTPSVGYKRWGGAFLRNVVKFKPDYTVSRLRTRQSPRSSPWETESCPSLSFCDRTAS